MKRLLSIFTVVTFLLCFINKPVYAATEISNQEVFDLLEDAFQAQLSLSQEPRTYDEVRSILSPYFAQTYIDLFLEENLYEEENGFIVYGSDFAMYYVPYFSYTEDTNVIYDKKEEKIYVYEHFHANTEGPVTFEDHYEMIILEPTTSSWIVADVVESKEIPEQVKELIKEQTTKSNEQDILAGIYKYQINSLYSLLNDRIGEPAIKNPFAYLFLYTKMVNGPN